MVPQDVLIPRRQHWLQSGLSPPDLLIKHSAAGLESMCREEPKSTRDAGVLTTGAWDCGLI